MIAVLQAYQVSSADRSFTYANLIVTVEDANVHHPQMEYTSYNTSIPENAPVGYTILQVHATDDDQVKTTEYIHNQTPRTKPVSSDQGKVAW